jgi:hypothetical protein
MLSIRIKSVHFTKSAADSIIHHGDLPLDRESCHTRLLSEDAAAHLFDDGFGGWLSVELHGLVFIIDIVSNTHEFATIVRACQQDNCYAQYLGGRYLVEVRRVGLEGELVHADRDGPDKERVEFLIMVGAAQMKKHR